MSIENLGAWIPKLIGAFAGALLSIIIIEPKTRREGWRRFIGSLIAGPIIAGFVLLQTEWPDTWDFLLLSALIAAFLSFPVMKRGYHLVQIWIDKKAE